MNSPSPTSQPTVNLPIASSSALSRSVFASPASPVKSGLLSSHPHLWTSALAPAPGCLQCSRCHGHLRYFGLSPRGLPRRVRVLVHNAFLPLFQSALCFRVPRGSCFPFASWFPSLIWPLSPPAPPQCLPTAAPTPWSSLLCISSSLTAVSAARVCCYSPFQSSA